MALRPGLFADIQCHPHPGEGETVQGVGHRYPGRVRLSVICNNRVVHTLNVLPRWTTFRLALRLDQAGPQCGGQEERGADLLARRKHGRGRGVVSCLLAALTNLASAQHLQGA